ncbi:hypothetical protein AVEN_66121-1 [Araneus ventricosus]|uniref:PiggyBac transposable element-derived protein domain-containing protein n=1 Tax=Araneus ventricosus TaxID=182803 RepID=A0A4Y2HI55_ARAVE|nr:hypothetical protein AVEN_66121-1 [Araneus ventricosus]
MFTLLDIQNMKNSDGNEELNAEGFDESDDDEEDILQTCEVDSDSSESDYNDPELDDANNDDFYVEKDNKIKWAKWIGRKNVKARSQNIITKLPGVIGSAKGMKTIYVSWNCFLLTKCWK